MVTRRNLLKQAFVISVGAVLVPSCMNDKSKASVISKNIPLNSEQENTLAALTETILPATDTPGAKEIGAHLFVIKMANDCFKKTDQQQFLKGLTDFEQSVQTKMGRSFLSCDAGQKNAVVASYDTATTQDAQNYFYSTVKRLTIQAYTSSEFFLTRIHVYKMIPGRFEGCVPLQKIA